MDYRGVPAENLKPKIYDPSEDIGDRDSPIQKCFICCKNMPDYHTGRTGKHGICRPCVNVLFPDKDEQWVKDWLARQATDVEAARAIRKEVGIEKQELKVEKKKRQLEL